MIFATILIMEQTKICFKCNKELPLSEYYKHKAMADGHLNKCKICTKKDSEDRRLHLIATSPEWVEKEAERQRQKVKRRYYAELKGSPDYLDRKKLNQNRYKEKYPEKIKASRSAATLDCDKDHRHHWSYKEENWKDIIPLDNEDHYFIHRYLTYDQENMCFRTPSDELLDTREKHEKFIMKILELK